VLNRGHNIVKKKLFFEPIVLSRCRNPCCCEHDCRTDQFHYRRVLLGTIKINRFVIFDESSAKPMFQLLA